ncbi:hypothetical protein L484_000055 [Morus notabilis]|uniref:Disease resistance N-terminal domain-containing protein n=1 Tax=Morus notabilis TaxID=981085 RepID=W9SQ94_9ROSA|nr:hypothetical protein L484_014536 [Morus notabilis]EXC42626.1 hypothetical protein L484_000594 [Morus notabilis]EXC64157.1 hypothetical protein L484_000055 [Morus notabilis]
MAEPLISVLLEQPVSATIGEVKQQVRLVTGVKKEVEKLNRNLRAIDAVFLDAEKQRVRDASASLWLDRLKDVSYDMDNVLDEWNTLPSTELIQF